METTTQCAKHAAAMAAKLINATQKVDHSKMDHSAMGHGNMDHSAMGHGGMDHSLMGGMVMTFHGGYKEQILFDFWETNTIGAFLLSCLALFVAAALYEGLKLGREKLIAYELKLKGQLVTGDIESKPTFRNCQCKPGETAKENGITSNDESAINQTSDKCCAKNNYNKEIVSPNTELLINRTDNSNVVVKSFSSRLLNRGHLCQTILHMVQISVSYLLMLVFMTYNSWLCLAVVLGAGAGYFLFGVQRLTSIDVNEHCH